MLKINKDFKPVTDEDSYDWLDILLQNICDTSNKISKKATKGKPNYIVVNSDIAKQIHT